MLQSTCDTVHGVTTLPPADLIDFFGRQANYIRHLEERLSKVQEDLARTRSRVGLIMEYLAAKFGDAAAKIRLILPP